MLPLSVSLDHRESSGLGKSMYAHIYRGATFTPIATGGAKIRTPCLPRCSCAPSKYDCKIVNDDDDDTNEGLSMCLSGKPLGSIPSVEKQQKRSEKSKQLAEGRWNDYKICSLSSEIYDQLLDQYFD